MDTLLTNATELVYKKILPTAVDVRRSAMDLLAHREHSQQELVLKLNKKLKRHYKIETSVESEQLEALVAVQVEQLSKENLQSDERFVESFINGRRAQGKGPLRIRQELTQKKIASQLIEAVLIDEDEQWQVLAQKVYEKKFGDTKPKDYKEQAKRLRFMSYRGFPLS